MTRTDTIVAAATPPGRGGVGIVRVSGPKTPEIAAVMLGDLPEARRATFARFLEISTPSSNVVNAALTALAPTFSEPHWRSRQAAADAASPAPPEVPIVSRGEALVAGPQLKYAVLAREPD